jgi:hypothetical protein
MNFWDVLGMVGGIQQVFLWLSAYIFGYYSKICFEIHAISEHYIIETKDEDFLHNKKIKSFNFCHKIRILTHCFPNKKL